MQENIQKIVSWDYNDFNGLIAFLKSVWKNPKDVIVDWTFLGGQQYCEFSVHNTENIPEQTQYINALLSNKEIKNRFHYKWIKGGNNYFLVNVSSLGWIPVSQYIRERKITRQAFWNKKDSYKLIYISHKRVLVNVKNINDGKQS